MPVVSETKVYYEMLNKIKQLVFDLVHLKKKHFTSLLEEVQMTWRRAENSLAI